MKNQPDVALLAWTTTPWTLPSNFALCVNAEMEYVTVVDKAKGSKYIMAKSRLSALYKNESEYSVVSSCKGAALEGTEYVPLFDYFAATASPQAYRVLVDPYVTDDSGTGIVHNAPAFGEDDYRVCLKYLRSRMFNCVDTGSLLKASHCLVLSILMVALLRKSRILSACTSRTLTKKFVATSKDVVVLSIKATSLTPIRSAGGQKRPSSTELFRHSMSPFKK
jgi:hypothetical protein